MPEPTQKYECAMHGPSSAVCCNQAFAAPNEPCEKCGFASRPCLCSMPEPTPDALRERVVVAVQRLRAIGAMFPEANADADAIDALLALRPTEPTPEQGRVETTDA